MAVGVKIDSRGLVNDPAVGGFTVDSDFTLNASASFKQDVGVASGSMFLDPGGGGAGLVVGAAAASGSALGGAALLVITGTVGQQGNTGIRLWSTGGTMAAGGPAGAAVLSSTPGTLFLYTDGINLFFINGAGTRLQVHVTGRV